MPKSQLDKNYQVSKKSEINEFHPRGMTLQELRFFAIYLSKINPKDVNTRVVRFPLADFQAIMEFGRIDTKKLKSVVDGLLMKVTGETLPSGGFVRFTFFKECILDKDENDEWYIEFDIHDRAIPHVFNPEKYVRYKLWNALRLKSKNQLRMYEVLKQYEKIGSLVIPIMTLKERLDMDSSDYVRFNDFKVKVLNVCQNALAHYTDISFTYKPHGRKGRGGKITNLKFTITENQDFVDPLSLDKFIETTRLLTGDIDIIDIDEEQTGDRYYDRISLLMEACQNEFSRQEVEYINSLVFERKPYTAMDTIRCYDYLIRKHKEMMLYDKTHKKVRYKFKYFCSIIGTE
jgi:hypothetical protein